MTSPVLGADHAMQLRPLEGKRIVLTRPHVQAGDFESRIRALGGKPLIAPAIATVPPDTWVIADAALRRIGTYDWIVFTSANAVRAVVERADAIDVARDELRVRRLAVVGTATADVVTAALRAPDIVASIHTAEALGHDLVDVAHTRVLLPRGDLAGDALPVALRKRGAFVDEVVVYQTVAGRGIPDILAHLRSTTVDALLFASASAVNFVSQAITADAGDTSAPLLARPLAVCLGPLTAAAARAAGFTRVVVADGTTQDELIERVVEWFTQNDSGGKP